ncbi:MAG: 50S ribosomal protein L1 [Planctomycetia bacterium]|nr:50S ribosomal protein L1 [Planctomycetia bacterium]
MASKGKRFQASVGLLEKPAHTVDEGVAVLKKMPAPKFDQTVELSLCLGIDARQSDQQLRGAVTLPKGLGKTFRVIAFVGPDLADKATAAGAVEAGLEDLVKKIEGGWMDFDVAVAHPSSMPKIGKLGRVLGPQGKMPNPKSGTVTQDVEKAVQEFAGGKVEYRNDSGGNVHVPVGKMSFDAAALKENIVFFINHVRRLKPAAAKGIFIRRIVICGTMTPAVEIDPDSVPS